MKYLQGLVLKLKSLIAELKKIQQTGSVDDYRAKFEELRGGLGISEES